MTEIRIEAYQHVRLIRFSAPPHGILTAGGTRLLAAAFDKVSKDPEVRAIIITGSDPGVFIRHYDLASIGKAATALRDGAIDTAAFLEADFGRLTDAIAGCPLPVIAAINGICMGGGLEIALACDIRIAQDDVQHIGLPEIRADIFPGGGGTQRLLRLIGEAAALDLLLRGRTMDARRAHELGLVGDVAKDAVSFALDLARGLGQRDPEALAAIKRLVRTSGDMPLDKGLARERLAFAEHLERSDRALATMEDILASGVQLEDRKLGD